MEVNKTLRGLPVSRCPVFLGHAGLTMQGTSFVEGGG